MEEFARSCRDACQAEYLGDNRAICTVLESYKLALDTRDIGLAPHLICDGFWEPSITRVFYEKVRPGMFTLDVGANAGYYTVLLASLTGKEGRVLAVEPNPVLVACIDETIRINGFESFTTVVRNAVSARRGNVLFYTDPKRNINACIIPRQDWRNYKRAHISRLKALPIDDLVADWPRVDFVKIDVEGAEALAWAGMRRTIAANPDIRIVLEYNQARVSKPKAFIASIKAAGFPLRHITNQGDIVTSVPEQLIDPHDNQDWILYLHRDADGRGERETDA
jgi:FkbM family methyltransferase